MGDELLSFAEAATFLDVSEKVLMRLLAEEAIPARKLGIKWRFSKSALISWIAQGNSMNYANSGKPRLGEEDD